MKRSHSTSTNPAGIVARTHGVVYAAFRKPHFAGRVTIVGSSVIVRLPDAALHRPARKSKP